MRVGLLGGSFNPAHDGHAHVADTAMKALSLHKVIWLVSPQNPLKAEPGVSLAARVASAARVAKGPRMVVTGVEADLGSNYTADTLRWFRRRYPGVRFFWLAGTDNLVGLHRWRHWRDLPGLVEFAVVPRPGSTVRGRLALGGHILRNSGRSRFLEAPLNAASSTALRERVMDARLL